MLDMMSIECIGKGGEQNNVGHDVNRVHREGGGNRIMLDMMSIECIGVGDRIMLDMIVAG